VRAGTGAVAVAGVAVSELAGEGVRFGFVVGASVGASTAVGVSGTGFAAGEQAASRRAEQGITILINFGRYWIFI
jgi:hypothetical protein